MKARWNSNDELWTTREPKRMLTKIWWHPVRSHYHTSVLFKRHWQALCDQSGQVLIGAPLATAKRAAEKLLGAEVKP